MSLNSTLYTVTWFTVHTCSFTLSCPIYLSGWVAAKSVRLYVDKNYRYHYLSILGYDPPENQCLETISAGTKTKEMDEEQDFDSGKGGAQENDMALSD